MKHAAYSSDTGDEAAGVFRLAPPSPDPLPAYTRTAIVSDDDGPVARVAYHKGRLVRLAQQHLTAEG
jgi:hypothetical protein